MYVVGVKKDYSLELNLMFQNLKTKKLDVIITRKENSVSGGNMVHSSAKKKKNPQLLQPGHPFGKSRITVHQRKMLLLLLQSKNDKYLSSSFGKNEQQLN